MAAATVEEKHKKGNRNEDFEWSMWWQSYSSYLKSPQVGQHSATAKVEVAVRWLVLSVWLLWMGIVVDIVVVDGCMAIAMGGVGLYGKC